MCSQYEDEFEDLLQGWGIPRHEWGKFADTYAEWKEMKVRTGQWHSSIAPTRRGLVIKADGSISEMHWGYMRQRERADGKGLKAPAPTVNARSEKIANANSMWYESWSSGRRCIIPVSAFYEWTYPDGQMVTHRFHMGGIGFGVAGLWEDDPKFGLCYTMLTTLPNAEVARTGHDRCLVVLKDETEASRWLGGEDFERGDFLRPDGMFEVESGVANPRASTGRKKAAPKPPPDPPAQGELF